MPADDVCMPQTPLMPFQSAAPARTSAPPCQYPFHSNGFRFISALGTRERRLFDHCPLDFDYSGRPRHFFASLVSAMVAISRVIRQLPCAGVAGLMLRYASFKRR
jgi:hypothetical protein